MSLTDFRSSREPRGHSLDTTLDFSKIKDVVYPSDQRLLGSQGTFLLSYPRCSFGVWDLSPSSGLVTSMSQVFPESRDRKTYPNDYLGYNIPSPQPITDMFGGPMVPPRQSSDYLIDPVVEYPVWY